jgi:PAS domain S-box-containing protein
MLFEDSLMGSLGLTYDPGVARISEKVFPLLNTIGEIIASAIHRNRMEASLHDSEERFRLLSNASFEGIAISDQGHVLDVNEQLAKFLGYKPEEIIGMSALNFVAPESRELVLNQIASGHDIPYEHMALKKDGSIFPVEVHGKSIPYKGRSIRVSAIRDMSERKRNEDALRESEAHKALILRSLPMAFYSAPFDQDEFGVWFSEQVHKISGFSAEDFITDRNLWESRIHPEDRDHASTSFERLNEQDSSETEYRWRTADGQYRWFLDQAVLVQGENGEREEIIGSWMDITDIKRAQEDLQSAFDIERVVATISSRLAAIREDTFDTEIELSLRDLGLFLGATRCNLFQASVEAEHFELTHDWCDEGVPSLKDEVLRLERRDLPWIIKDLEKGEIIHIPDVANLPDEAAAERAFALAHGTLSFLQFPMYFEGELIGTIGINYDQKGTDHVGKPVPLLKTLGELFASAIARKRAEEATRRSEATLQGVFRTAPIGIGLINNRVIEWTNDAFQKMMGYTAFELHGEHERILYENEEECERVAQDHFELFEEEGMGETTTRFKCKDGKILNIVYRASPILAGELMTGVIFTALDITEQVKYVEALQKNSERLEILHSVDQALLEAESTTDIAQKALHRVGELIPCDVSIIVLFEIDDDIFFNVIASMPDFERFAPGQKFSLPGEAYQRPLKLLKYGRPVITDDVQKLEHLNPLLMDVAKAGLRSMLLSPMIVRGELIGVFGLGSNMPDHFMREHIEIAKEVADSLATSIHQTRLLEIERMRRHELEIFEGVSIALRRADKQEGLLSILLEETIALFQADASAIWIPQTGEIEQIIGHDLMRPEDLILNMQSLMREFQSIMDTDQPAFFSEMPFHMDNVTSMIVTPLRAENLPDRTLALYYGQKKEFTEDEQRFLKTITDVVVIGLGRIAILESLEKQVIDRTREITTLYDLAEISALSEGTSMILEKSLKKIVASVGCEAGMIHLFNEESNALELIVQECLSPEIQDEVGVIPPNDRFWMRSIEQREPILQIDIREDIDAPTLLKESNLRHFLSAPIILQDKPLGILSVFHSPDHDPSVEEANLLSLVSDQIALTVERAQLRDKAKDTVIVAERERMARGLHDSVTQTLYSLSFTAKASRNYAKQGEWQYVEEHLRTIQESAQQSLKEMRLLVYELMPVTLKEQGLINVLGQRLDFVENRLGINVEYHTVGSFDLPLDIQMGIYSIAQEALNNTLKYSGATHISLRLHHDVGRIELEVEDNGEGFDLNHPSGGMGLPNMYRRAQQIGGDLSIKSNGNLGTSVKMIIDEVRT